MAEKTEVKQESLPDLDDLLQCPVCYELPTGQIFQCNQGHHVCGRCKARLNECPVCRALFFGTRNYAMEELIANIRRLRAFKLGGKVTTGSTTDKLQALEECTSKESENNNNVDSEGANGTSTPQRAPQACKGLFRCLCCNNGSAERLPVARMLNHLRYYHAPLLIEGTSENGEYLQAWNFPTIPGRIVTAVRVSDMGIFFLIIEITENTISSWLSMLAAPWVAQEFSYQITISGSDREAIFSDSVWSVRSCEGSLKKRGHCLVVEGSDAQALIAPANITARLTIRRSPPDQLANQTQPRALLRVACRGDETREPAEAARAATHDLEPFLQDLQNDVARLSIAFASLGREANALARSEAEVRSRNQNGPRTTSQATVGRSERGEGPAIAVAVSANVSSSVAENEVPATNGSPQMSRNARRRMRQRLRAALDANQTPIEQIFESIPRQNGPLDNLLQNHLRHIQQEAATSPDVLPQSSNGSSSSTQPNQNRSRRNKKRRNRNQRL